MSRSAPFLAALLLAPLAVPHGANAEPARPNIVLILADDLGYGSLGCYGNAEVATPHIDRLARGGVRLTDFHSNGALCSPTRAALLTGRYPQRCAEVPDAELSPVFREQRRANPVQRWAWGLCATERTMPAVLKQAGYRTALIGKWHLGYDAKFHPMNYGFDEFRGFVGGNVDYHTHVAGYGTKELDWWNDRRIANEAGYSTDLLTTYAAEFIARNKDAPFFLYLAHGAVHTPLQGRESARKRSPVDTYKEMVGTLDDSVGMVVAALCKHRLETNTLVIFCSDNGPAAPPGFAANAGLRGKKGTLFEGGHRVPFIASWPGTIAPGTTSDAAAMSMDLFPTFAAVADARLPADRQLDGIDLLPLLKGGAAPAPRDLHWQSGEDWAVRRGSWKLAGKRNKALSLINLQHDIGEADNLLEREPALVKELMEAHAHWVQSIGSRSREHETP